MKEPVYLIDTMRMLEAGSLKVFKIRFAALTLARSKTD
jgi:hypothetical protein